MAQGGGKGMAGILLVILIGLGGFNYHRNYEREQQEAREQTFGGYDDAGLEALAQAYEAEAEGLDEQYRALRARRARVEQTRTVDDGVKQFERVQRTRAAVRDVTEALATNEARLREIREEQRRRAARGAAWAVHLERLTGLELPIEPERRTRRSQSLSSVSAFEASSKKSSPVCGLLTPCSSGFSSSSLVSSSSSSSGAIGRTLGRIGAVRGSGRLGAFGLSAWSAPHFGQIASSLFRS